MRTPWFLYCCGISRNVGWSKPRPHSTTLQICAHQCKHARTRRGGRPCPPGRTQAQKRTHPDESAQRLYGSMPRSPRTTHDRFYETLRQICRCPNGRTEASAPTVVLRCRRLAVRCCDCILRGRGRTPPLLYDEKRWCSVKAAQMSASFCRPIRSGGPPLRFRTAPPASAR